MFLIIAAPALAQFYQSQFGASEPAQQSPEQELSFTTHAKCRMSCRNISKQDVDLVLENGELNLQKSDPEDRPCPSYAYEGKGLRGERLRVVLAHCPSENRVVTAINLQREFRCDCE